MGKKKHPESSLPLPPSGLSIESSALGELRFHEGQAIRSQDCSEVSSSILVEEQSQMWNNHARRRHMGDNLSPFLLTEGLISVLGALPDPKLDRRFPFSAITGSSTPSTTSNLELIRGKPQIPQITQLSSNLDSLDEEQLAEIEAFIHQKKEDMLNLTLLEARRQPPSVIRSSSSGTDGVVDGGITKVSNKNSVLSLNKQSPYAADRSSTTSEVPLLSYVAEEGEILGSPGAAAVPTPPHKMPLLTYATEEGEILASPKVAAVPTPPHNHNKALEQQNSASSNTSSSWAARLSNIKSVGSTPLQFIHPKSGEQGNVIELEEEEFEKEIEKSKRFLVGYFIGRRLPLHLVRGQLSSQWSLKGSIEIQPRGISVFTLISLIMRTGLGFWKIV